MRKLIQIAFCIAFATATFAQGFGLPPGKWWKMPRVVQRLELTQGQQNELDEVFRKSAPELIDLKAELEKATIALRGAVDRPNVDRTEVRKAAEKLNAARGRLFERELMMLVDMRTVLSETQWNELRRSLDQRQRRGRN